MLNYLGDPDNHNRRSCLSRPYMGCARNNGRIWRFVLRCHVAC